MHTHDNHLQAAFNSSRYLLTQDADVFTDVDRSYCYDRIEELRERYASSRLRRASGKTGDRSTSGGDRSNFEGDRSNFEHDRGKSSPAGARIGSIPCQIVRRPRQLGTRPGHKRRRSQQL